MLYVAGGGGGEDGGGRMTTFAVDPATGALQKVAETAVGKNPIRMLVVELPADAP